MYNVNFQKLAIMLLPTFLRNGLTANIAKAAIAAMDGVATSFEDLRAQQDYILAHNGQRCYLRKVLNDYFDSDLRRITIDDLPAIEGLYLYPEATQATFHPLEPDYLVIARDGYADNGYDFIVTIPAELELIIDSAKLNAIINNYKLLSKRYLINYI